MKRFTAFFIILLLFTSLTYASRGLPWIELVFSPAKTTETAQKSRLLATTDEQTNADVAALYQKANRSLPQDYQPKQFSDWRRLPPDQLPVREW